MQKLKISKNIMLLFAMLLAAIVMGIGYASIESVTGEIEGKVIADAQSGVFITDVEYVSDVDANISNCKIDNFLGTMLNSTIELSKTNPESEIRYKITVYNNSEEEIPFVGVIYDDDFYDNPDITFEITTEGFKIGEAIAQGETKEVYIVFKYKHATTENMPENTILKSYLNFKMAEPNRMVVAGSEDASGKYLTSSIAKEKIESIKFEQGKEPEYSDKIIARFDASEKQDESTLGYYTDEDNNGLYELTFVSQEIIYANKEAQYLFRYLINLKNIEFGNFSTSGTQNMLAMFNGDENLNNLDLNNFDTSQVTNMHAMFLGCTSLNELKINSFETGNVTDMSKMFSQCYNITNLGVSNFNTEKVTDMSYMFGSCYAITELDVRNFDTKNVTNLQGMFQDSNNLKKLDLKNFNTMQVTNMATMFYACNGLLEVDVSDFNTSNVITMNEMFYKCKNLIKLDITSFDTSQVTDMRSMFSYCNSLTELNIKNFNTSKVTNLSGMFAGCGELIKIYVKDYNEEENTGWNTIAVENSTNMFRGDNNIIGGNGTTYNSNYIDATYARIDTAETPGYFTNIKDKPTGGTE